MGLMSMFQSDMAIPVNHSVYVGKNENTGIEEYVEKITKCRVDGSRRYVRDSEGSKKISQQTYISTEKIAVGDRLNGQYVFSVRIIYDFDGEILHYEASVG